MVLLIYCFTFWLATSLSQEIGQQELLYDFVFVDYDWPSEKDRDDAIANGDYVIENNVITGIKTYQGEVYVTVSRWLLGVPSTMNKVVMKEGKAVLQPYPSWEMQEVDNCKAFQFTQSMEIDPYSGVMWIIDAGRRNIWEASINNCPPKLYALDMTSGEIILEHAFPTEVLDHEQNFVNDLVLDLHNGFVYMSDVGIGHTGHRGGLVVYDINQDVSHRLEHSSMDYEPDGTTIVINGTGYLFDTPIDGIGLSPDAEYIFYCPLGGYNLWRIPGYVARSPEGVDLDDVITLVGKKISQADGIVLSNESLYFAAMELSAVYKWEYRKDMMSQGVGLGEVVMETETLVAIDAERMVWADTFHISQDGWLYFTPNKLPMFRYKELDFQGTKPNFYIWRIYIGEDNYLPRPRKQ